MALSNSRKNPTAIKSVDLTSSNSVSESTRSYEALEMENEELRRSGQQRSLFLSRLAHELRTPLTSILGFAEILLTQEHLTEPQRSFCERIQSSAQQLQNSLNQLSDLSRLETGRATLRLEEFSIADLVKDIFAALARQCEKKGVKFVLHANDSLPIVLSDRGRLRQSIYSVLQFAIARSPFHASVSVDLEQDNDQIVMTIVDNGDPLIDPLSLGTLESSERLDSNELALVIARQSIQLLNGAMNARNQDQGLEIRINLPTPLPST